MYRLTLNEKGRIVEAAFVINPNPGDITVDTLPSQTEPVDSYVYRNGEMVYDPLPKPESELEKPTRLDAVEAQAMYTAMMTDTMMEVSANV